MVLGVIESGSSLCRKNFLTGSERQRELPRSTESGFASLPRKRDAGNRFRRIKGLNQMSTTIARLPVAPIELECPFCKAGIGEACITSAGKSLGKDSLGDVVLHVARIKKAAEAHAGQVRQSRG
jgi:hypothetical protein